MNFYEYPVFDIFLFHKNDHSLAGLQHSYRINLGHVKEVYRYLQSCISVFAATINKKEWKRTLSCKIFLWNIDKHISLVTKILKGNFQNNIQVSVRPKESSCSYSVFLKRIFNVLIICLSCPSGKYYHLGVSSPFDIVIRLKFATLSIYLGFSSSPCKNKALI